MLYYNLSDKLLCIVCTLPGANIAHGKSATQSPGTYNDSGAPYPAGYTANLAVDGNTNSDFTSSKSCTHTIGVPRSGTQHKAEWIVDLGRDYKITGIVIYNRQGTSLFSTTH